MPDKYQLRLMAPSGWPDQVASERGLARLEPYCTVTNQDALKRRYLRFAGTDAQRAHDINQLADPSRRNPDILLAVRGGYGVHRILPLVDYAGLQRACTDDPVIMVGYSDITALQLALLAQTGLVTFAGPMLAHDFGAVEPSDFTMREFWQTLTHATHSHAWQADAAADMHLTGTLWGGNLAVVCSLLGTPYFPHIDGGILFLEDIGEPWYRIERMLLQLKLAGVLDQQQMVLLGHFSDNQPDHYAPDYALPTIVDYIRSLTGAPIMTGLPLGHDQHKLTLPIGATATLTTDAHGQATLTYTNYPYLAAIDTPLPV